MQQSALLIEILARAMHDAHAHDIVHRDLKPANVLMTKDGVPKITDFGLAKRLEEDSSQTRSGTLMGTPSYMAPEQARGDIQSIGPSADLYALGAILYEMLTGRPPFLAPKVMDTLMQVIHQDPVPPSRLQPRVPRDLETICLKCLQKEPGKRYESTAELADDLHRFQNGEPIRARPVRAPELAWRWCRRNPRLAALAAAVIVLFAVSAIALNRIAKGIAEEKQNVAETRQLTTERMEESVKALKSGDVRRARDLVLWHDPVLTSHEALTEQRLQLAKLQSQIDAYDRFAQLIDRVRYAGLFSSRGAVEDTGELCGELLQFIEDIEGEKGQAPDGLPPLSTDLERRFREDVFDAYLIAAEVESDLPPDLPPDQSEPALRQAIQWLNLADTVLPGTRTVLDRRSDYWERLGDASRAESDREQAAKVVPESAVDRFWQGLDENRKGDVARSDGRPADASGHFNQALEQHLALLQDRPDHFWGYFGWATSQVRSGTSNDLANAMVGFTSCINIRPDVPWPYYNRGTIHFNLEAVCRSNRGLRHGFVTRRSIRRSVLESRLGLPRYGRTKTRRHSMTLPRRSQRTRNMPWPTSTAVKHCVAGDNWTRPSPNTIGRLSYARMIRTHISGGDTVTFNWGTTLWRKVTCPR